MTHPATEARLVVQGTPRGKGRPKFVRATGRTYTDTQTRSAEQQVRDAWILADRPDLGDGPLCMTLSIVVERPKGHYRVNGELSAQGLRQPVPIRKPDADNVVKLIADALNGLAYGDDAQIATGMWARRWATPGEREHVGVRLRCTGERVTRSKRLAVAA